MKMKMAHQTAGRAGDAVFCIPHREGIPTSDVAQPRSYRIDTPHSVLQSSVAASFWIRRAEENTSRGMTGP